MSVETSAPPFADLVLERTLETGRPTWALVDLDALVANLGKIRRLCSGANAEVLAVVKADAYGLGATRISSALQDAGTKWFGVASVEEGQALRAAGIKGRILLLGGLFPQQAAAAVDADLTPAVFTTDCAVALAAAVPPEHAPFPVHLKIDTGMGRLGVPLRDLATFLDATPELAPQGPLKLEGVFTHLARADETGGEAAAFTRQQLDRFSEGMDRLRERGHSELETHFSNSAATLDQDVTGASLVRPGLALYGADPSGRTDLSPVLHWCSRILFLKNVEPGDAVGYGATWTATGPRRIATLPVGYYDGYDRRLSNSGRVGIGGKSCPVVGRVSMDLITVDVTEVPGARQGDLAWLLEGPGGEGPTVTLASMARTMGGLPYEILCGLSRRVPRLYLKNRRVIEVRQPS